MTSPTKLFPERMTWREKYDPAMAIMDQAEADAYFERLVEHCLRLNLPGMTRWQAEERERHNLGYWTGYYDNETRARVERLFHCAHPIFGPIERFGNPTFDEAVQAGIRMAKELGRRDSGQ